MGLFVKDTYRLKDKVQLTLRVNYFSSIISVVLGLMCLYTLDIYRILPFAFFAYSVINIINTLAYYKHKNLVITYNITSIVALICAVIITLFSGGINSPFIFVLALIVLTGYATTRLYGKVYLYLNMLIVIILYIESTTDLSFTENMVPESSRNLFSFLSVFFSVYLMGDVLGKNLLKAHHNLYKSRNEVELRIKEKETLLKEIHHRVKNNLQTVSSLLNLQSRSIEDENIKSLIKSSQNRVISMAMVHEMLYMRNDLAKIEYRSYVKDLAEYLINSIKGANNNVKLKIEIPEIKLDIDTAIPLGLLINEVITNSLKYGIKDDSQGVIHIEMEHHNNKDYKLNIGDNGIGFPEAASPTTRKSLGLKLIYNLARQLKGTVDRDYTKKGTHYIITFKEVSEQIHSVD
ncbi:sensor histidine kinase [Kriegella aquimaris]|uniref:histidine kinase n=1 Tax=Kriegella aquimaris TaxID=192904 RepID=A0A1G9UF69_9FLAO|nr:sensor histidine kinase [Kriegella aquimaris]SDM58538.1 Two-component sensor histidine kinase, contains HisKA and HATPase domains [Kriegella aquimaris]